MNTLSVHLEILQPGVVRTIDHITFSKAAFVIATEGSSLAAFLNMSECLIVASELIKSIAGSGCYLIFTSASGIADDAGWEGINIFHKGNELLWEFDFNEKSYRWRYQMDKYKAALRQLEEAIKQIPQGITLEPSQVVFPEEWQ